MSVASETLSGKTHRDENFPVASWLVSKKHRGPILAFYRFARAADDIADHPTLSADEKIARLDRMKAALDGSGPKDPLAEPLRLALKENALTPQHAFELLEAFHRDAINEDYRTWADLMGYCRLSAMPVGRFVLDVHGESRTLWPGSDALCAALQIINHLQDCADDFKAMNRVYLPSEIMAKHDATRDMLGADVASPALKSTIAELAGLTAGLVDEGAPLVGEIKDGRLGLEIAVIHALSQNLVAKLQKDDPLSQTVHHSKFGFALIGLFGALRYLGGRLTTKRSAAGRS